MSLNLLSLTHPDKLMLDGRVKDSSEAPYKLFTYLVDLESVKVSIIIQGQ